MWAGRSTSQKWPMIPRKTSMSYVPFIPPACAVACTFRDKKRELNFGSILLLVLMCLCSPVDDNSLTSTSIPSLSPSSP